jgi:hypothetical protein
VTTDDLVTGNAQPRGDIVEIRTVVADWNDELTTFRRCAYQPIRPFRDLNQLRCQVCRVPLEWIEPDADGGVGGDDLGDSAWRLLAKPARDREDTRMGPGSISSAKTSVSAESPSGNQRITRRERW